MNASYSDWIHDQDLTILQRSSHRRERGVRQEDTISPKLFSATLENVFRELEWDDIGVNVDDRILHYLRFADDIMLITPSISPAERMLINFDRVCGNVGLQLNLTKTMFMRNGQ
ncbi:unnamed protein product, partial [Heligmosomoides polygyrus]|uniref:Reverse transcriptase domain-containing protein n=1 Tax=Heligmosomoides polygyrus TaxID=6339 RepID=A0A183FBI8_HELPZ